MGSADGGAEPELIRTLRAILLGVLLVGVLGTLAELYLLEHYEDTEQFVPLVLLTAASFVGLLCTIRPAPATVRALQVLMAIFVISGAVGVYYHYSGNTEFELEMYPNRGGLELFWESMKGATPVLAPGSMTQLGLLGLAYCFRHPLLRKKAS